MAHLDPRPVSHEDHLAAAFAEVFAGPLAHMPAPLMPVSNEEVEEENEDDPHGWGCLWNQDTHLDGG